MAEMKMAFAIVSIEESREKHNTYFHTIWLDKNPRNKFCFWNDTNIRFVQEQQE